MVFLNFVVFGLNGAFLLAQKVHILFVCTIHQNIKLMLSAIGLETSYHEIIEKIVCSRKSKVCIIHRCISCPGIQLPKTISSSMQ